MRRGCTWVCVAPGCSFTRRSRASFAEAVGHVEKLARRRVDDGPWIQRIPANDLPPWLQKRSS